MHTENGHANGEHRHGEEIFMKTTRFVQVVLMFLLATGLSLAQTPANSTSIVEVAAADGSFHTMVSFIRASGMVPMLRGKGPYTIFAPTDAAFARLPVDMQKKLFENPHFLPLFLNRYIVSGTLTSAGVSRRPKVRTLDGRNLSIERKAGTVLVNHAQLIRPDIVTGNGVIHGIDSVDMGMVHEFLEQVQKSKTSAARH
jgi:uncharacterized surface protein with fasciclin (FAS1) repeats